MRALKTRTSGLALAAGVAASWSGASAAVLTWNLAGGGSAGVAGTWNPAQVPAAGDILNYNTAGFHVVSFTAANPVPTVQQQNFNFGQYNLANGMGLGVPQVSAQQFVVGLVAGSNAQVSLAQGQFNCNGTLSVGGNATGVGELNVISGSFNVIGSANVARIGNTGAGTLTVENGADFVSDGVISIARLAGSSGTATVTGVSGADPSEMNTLNTSTGDLFVAEQGPGTLSITEGGEVSIADDVFIAPNAGFTGTTTLSSTTTNDSDLIVAGDVLVAANTSAAGAGTGELIINNGAQAVVAGTVRVGDADGGFGTLRINDVAGDGAASLMCDSLIFDATGHGGIDFRDGLIRIQGGTFVPPGASFSLNGIGGATRPTLLFDAGATSTMGSLSVGTTNNALCFIAGGSTVTTGAITLAQSASSTSGRLEVAGGNLNFPGQSITVGNQGDGVFTVEDGGVASGGSMSIANIVGSVSTATIDGAGSTLTLTSDITMSALGGTGTPTLRVLDSGVLNVGGVINANSNNSLIVVDNATINATDVFLFGTAAMQASGRVNADLSGATQPAVSVTLTGPLDAGRDGFATSVGIGGSFNVGAHALTLRGTAFNRLGDISIAGGSISATAAPINQANGDSLTGFGTINADYEVAGSTPVVATGVGLTFNGDVSQFIATNPMNFSGTTFTFGPASTFSGKGTVAAQVAAQSGSVITATGDLSMGVTSNPFGVTLPGAALHVGPHHVTLNDSNGLSIGTCDINGGTLELVGTATGRLLNTNGGSLSGQGNVITPRFANISGGHVSPGASGASGVGTLTFSGTYDSGDIANPAGTVNIQLAGELPSQFDRLISTGNASLDGTLNVTLTNGYDPQPGVFHTIVSSTGGFVLGDFAVRNMPANFIRIFTAGGYAVGERCPTDMDDGEGGGNSDGSVDIADLLYYLQIFDLGDLEADLDDGSGTGTTDGVVDIADLLYFLEHFDLGC